jgi:hypothetical protein
MSDQRPSVVPAGTPDASRIDAALAEHAGIPTLRYRQVQP